MSAHLLVVSLGPVQDFIAAARRTRDLWFGSFLLSEISKAAAARIAGLAGGHDRLIFPAPNNANDLTQGSSFNVANIILAELPAGVAPADIAKEAKAVAQACWEKHANEALRVAGRLINKDIWREQVGDVIEFYAAWVPLASSDNYSEARTQVMRLLAGRKACRDFVSARGHAGVPKSSLDGARESVLIGGKGANKTRRDILAKDGELTQRLRFSRGEELDVVGVTKRTAIKAVFPSVVRVAADPWMRGIETDGGKAKEILRQIDAECRGAIVEKDDDASHSAGSGKECYRNSTYRHDGSTLFPNRIDSMLRATRKDNDSYAFEALLTTREQESLKRIKSLLDELQKEQGYGQAEPYLAVIAADGDRMGETLSKIKTADEHRAFSKRLARFAGEAEGIVKKHCGCLVYSGGDDVLAFVPIDKCLLCARELHEKFGTIVGEVTLSVGIAIGHCMESLEDLLAFARAAEKSAKQPDRDGLAVHLYSRGGAPIEVRSRWGNELDKSLMEWAQMHLDNTLPDKAAFDLRTLAKDYAGWPITEVTNEAIKRDIGRLFSRKGGDAKLDVDLCLKELNRCLKEIPNAVDENDEHKNHHPAAMRLAEEWLIARRLARAMKQASGKEKQAKEETTL